MSTPPNPRLLGEEVPARNTPMIQFNLSASHNKEVLSLGTGEGGKDKFLNPGHSPFALSHATSTLNAES